MTIGQVAAGDKESEITAARSLLGLTDLTGTLVTGDALHCQGETARLMKDGGGEWLFTLKANRPAQHAEVRAWFADPANDRDGKHTTTDADNGRIEDRRHAVSHDVSWMLSGRRHPDEAPMPGLATPGMAEPTVIRDGKATTQRHFYLSSASLSAVTFAAAVRVHWRIENCLHWVLDVGFDQDRARNRKDRGPENLTYYGNWRSTSCEQPTRISRSDESASAPDGPTGESLERHSRRLSEQGVEVGSVPCG